MKRRTFLLGATAALAPRLVAAQSAYPSRPSRIIVPYAPGGITDTLARLVGERLSAALGQSFVIENRPGGGTVVGTKAVVDAEPDGYTLLMGTTVLSINPALLPSVPYDALRDLAPIANVGSSAAVIAVNKDVPVRTLAELVALDKAKPGTLAYGSAGQGSTSHIAGEYLNKLAGTRFSHVPHRGSAPMLTNVVGGHVAIAIDVLTSAKPFLDDGSLRPLAVLDPTRSAFLPNVPTAGEAGVPGLIIQSYYGLLAPKRTPAVIVERLNAEVNKAIRDPGVVAKAAAQSTDLVGGTPAEFATRIEQETTVYRDIIRAASIQVAS